MTEPSAAPEHDRAPRIELAGRLWPVPLLAPRQNRVVVPAVLRLMPALTRLTGGEAGLAEALTQPEYDLLLDAVFWALNRAHPGLTRPQFDDMPIGTAELVEALPVIAQQSGMLKRSTQPGEGEAGSRRIGTGSSPASSG